jgi:hypothetical protein
MGTVDVDMKTTSVNNFFQTSTS